SNRPVTTEEMVGPALSIGGLVSGTEFPRVGAAALTSAAVKPMMPASRGINALVDAIGPENVPQVVAGMRANPRMTPADLSDPVRLTTQGLMAGGSPEVQDFIA